MDLNFKQYYLPDFTSYSNTIAVAVFLFLTLIFVFQKRRELLMRDYLIGEFLNAVRILNLETYAKIIASCYGGKTGEIDAKKITYHKFKSECKRNNLNHIFKDKYNIITGFRQKIAFEYLVLTALYTSLVYLLPDAIYLVEGLSSIINSKVGAVKEFLIYNRT